jgi:hypothetical protein
MEGNDATIQDPKSDDISAAEFHAMIASPSADAPEAAAFRWAVVIGGDGLLKLQLHGLPTAAAWLSSRHQFKG